MFLFKISKIHLLRFSRRWEKDFNKGHTHSIQQQNDVRKYITIFLCFLYDSIHITRNVSFLRCHGYVHNKDARFRCNLECCKILIHNFNANNSLNNASLFLSTFFFNFQFTDRKKSSRKSFVWVICFLFCGLHSNVDAAGVWCGVKNVPIELLNCQSEGGIGSSTCVPWNIKMCVGKVYFIQFFIPLSQKGDTKTSLNTWQRILTWRKLWEG